jgi:UDP-glucose 4-epimerase
MDGSTRSQAAMMLAAGLSASALTALLMNHSQSRALAAERAKVLAKEEAAKLKLPAAPEMAMPAANARHILVTGGTGFIGSHTVVVLLQAGYRVTIIDNLLNSSAESLNRVKHITGATDQHVRLVEIDLCDFTRLDMVFQTCGQIHCVIHFAGLKSVGESVSKPLYYYHNNLYGTTNLLRLMQQYNCTNIVFSSSATVYGNAEIPYSEGSKTGDGITNAYGRTKYMIEQFLYDLYHSEAGQDWGICILRYFNPVGAHKSGMIGEDPSGIPNNLMPYISQVCVGRRSHLGVHGSDYDTPDGTCQRDFIHVVDLAEGHLKAVELLERAGPQCEAFNLGSGNPVSVMELLRGMEKACGKEIPYKLGPRRPGDLPCFYAEPTKARDMLGWVATRDVDEMCEDSWRWQSLNPNGLNPPKAAPE